MDRERSRIFLEKADLPLPDATLAGLRSMNDAALGIDDAFLGEARQAFGMTPSAQIGRSENQGTFHRLYDVREDAGAPRLLRIAALARPSSAELMELECKVMDAVRGAGFAVPACEFRNVASRGVHLVDRAAGVSVTTLDDDEERMLGALGGVARFLANLHAIRGKGFGPVSLDAFRHDESRLAGLHARWDDYLFIRLDDHLRACEQHCDITHGESTDIAALFAAARPALQGQASALLHGDPGSHNFMVDESGIRAVIDWEDALLGDPLFDLASLCTFHPERRHAAIWSAYRAVLAPGSDAWQRFWLYFLRIALAKTVHRARFAYADHAGRPPASRRIQLSLQRLREGAP